VDADVVHLNNGDRISGVRQRFDRGLWEISAGRAGTIEIEWYAISTITNTLQFPVDLTSGQRFRGTADCCSAGLARADQVRAGCWNEEYRPHASYGKGFLVTDQRRGRTQIQA
jgi:hypothetical protein